MTVKNWLKGSLNNLESRSMLWTSELAKMNANLSACYSSSGAVSDIAKLINLHNCSQCPIKYRLNFQKSQYGISKGILSL